MGGTFGPGELGMSDADRAWMVIHSTVTVAMQVAAGRALEPGTFPIIPDLPDDELATWWTRRALGDLLDVGIAPDGWEQTYLQGGIVRGGAA